MEDIFNIIVQFITGLKSKCFKGWVNIKLISIFKEKKTCILFKSDFLEKDFWNYLSACSPLVGFASTSAKDLENLPLTFFMQNLNNLSSFFLRSGFLTSVVSSLPYKCFGIGAAMILHSLACHTWSQTRQSSGLRVLGTRLFSVMFSHIILSLQNSLSTARRDQATISNWSLHMLSFPLLLCHSCLWADL